MVTRSPLLSADPPAGPTPPSLASPVDPVSCRASDVLALGLLVLLVGACGSEAEVPEPPAAPTLPAEVEPETAPAPEAVVVPDVPAPTPAQLSLHSGFLPDPYVVYGDAGGDVEASERFGEECAGFVREEPNIELQIDNALSDLRVLVHSAADVTLVVDGPSGPERATRCGDDELGDLPYVHGRMVPGRYRVWVGSKERGARHEFRLGFSEIDAVTVDAVAAAAPSGPAVEDEAP